MQSTKSSILGISLGTRIVGVAVLCDNELLEWRIHTFKGVWSEKKSDEILKTVFDIISMHNIKKVALKRMCPLRAQYALLNLEHSFKECCKKQRIKSSQYTITQIRAFQETSSMKLEEELKYEYSRQQQLNTPYYAKLFEAVSLAHMGSDASKIHHAKKSH